MEQAFEKSFSPKYSMDVAAECFPNRFQYQLARHVPHLHSISSDVSQDSAGSHSPAESDVKSFLIPRHHDEGFLTRYLFFEDLVEAQRVTGLDRPLDRKIKEG